MNWSEFIDLVLKEMVVDTTNTHSVHVQSITMRLDRGLDSCSYSAVFWCCLSVMNVIVVMLLFP